MAAAAVPSGENWIEEIVSSIEGEGDGDRLTSGSILVIKDEALSAKFGREIALGGIEPPVMKLKSFYDPEKRKYKEAYVR